MVFPSSFFGKLILAKTYPGRVKEVLEKYSTPEALVSLLDESGIKRAVLLAEYSPGVTRTVTNEEVAKICRAAPRFIPFACINPNYMADPLGVFVQSIEQLGCRGLKLLPSYQNWSPIDHRMYPVYDAAQEMGIPLLFHTGSSVFKRTHNRYADPIWLDDIAAEFPKLILVQAHSDRGFWYEQAFFISRLRENVFMEISGLPPNNLLKYFPDFERNADKIIFGSDWPSTAKTRSACQ